MRNKILSLFILATTSLSAAPQAIVFDFGGVMTGEPNRQAVVLFLCGTFKISESEFETINIEKRQAIKQGKTDVEFWLAYAHQQGIALPEGWPAQFKSVLKDSIGVNPEMYALVEELKQKHLPVALLSNIDERLGKLLREFGYYEPFDPCLLSHEIGIEKPHLKIYQILLERLALPSQDVVFIDDKLENVEAAKKLGIDAILFKSTAELRQELQQRGL